MLGGVKASGGGASFESALYLTYDKDGHVTPLFVGTVPMEAFERKSGFASPKFHMLVLGLGLVVFLLTAGAALVRRFTPKVRRPPRLPGRALVVGLSTAFLLGAVGIAASAADVQSLLYNNLGKIKLALALPVIGALLTVAALVAAVWQWMSGAGTRGERLRYAAVVVVACLFVWSLNTWNLLGWRM